MIKPQGAGQSRPDTPHSVEIKRGIHHCQNFARRDQIAIDGGVKASPHPQMLCQHIARLLPRHVKSL